MNLLFPSLKKRKSAAGSIRPILEINKSHTAFPGEINTPRTIRFIAKISLLNRKLPAAGLASDPRK